LALVATTLLYLCTPSAGQATSLAAAQASEHHIAYPGPPVPQNFAEALVATEDHRFYTDPGLDPLALFRVAASWLTGNTDGGGSTIDQQLAKNLYTSGNSSFPQIVEQVVLAVKLNHAYSRAEILRLYAEIAYYGHGYYGLQAASCGYFGVPPAQLSVVQAAMLAGAVNAPTYDDPLVYPARARARLVHVIDRMAAVGDLTAAQQRAALSAPLGLPAVRGCQ
jgi:membrane peptidoglycan carboxypeptidase